jgi:nicotinate-nucleotide pyrophosphorylase (carboxylating)
MHSIEEFIEIALKEDIGPGDITTDNLIDSELCGVGTIIVKEPIVLAGMDVAAKVFQRLDPHFSFKPRYKDGDSVKPGENIVTISGNLRALLTGERTALNFLQRLSGIATLVRSYVQKLGQSTVRLVDTRKTTPGWRTLEKYAVRVGGAYNHRMGLYDGVLIKDNHIEVCGGISTAIEGIREVVSHLVKIEVEVSDLPGVEEALAAGADVIMLDNMDIQQITEAVKRINGKAVVEVSGGITDQNLKQLGKTGVDIISVGALTHSARCVDLSMRVQSSE